MFGGENGGGMSLILMMALMFGLMYFTSIRPQKKRQQQEQEMRNAVEVGDEITTIGGICGKVVIVKEQHLIIETGADRNRMQITRWAVQQNVTATERVKAEREAAKAAAVIEEGFKGIIPMKIVAFDTCGPVIHEVIKGWDESQKLNCCWNFAKHGRNGCGNDDGYDILVAQKELLSRPEEKKLLIVLKAIIQRY